MLVVRPQELTMARSTILTPPRKDPTLSSISNLCSILEENKLVGFLFWFPSRCNYTLSFSLSELNREMVVWIKGVLSICFTCFWLVLDLPPLIWMSRWLGEIVNGTLFFLFQGNIFISILIPPIIWSKIIVTNMNLYYWFRGLRSNLPTLYIYIF